MDPKKPKENRRRYDADFKNEVLKMVESGRPVPEIAQSLGIGNNLIYYWVKRAKRRVMPYKKPKLPELVFDEEKLALQKRVKELEMEREILKKPWAFSVVRCNAGVRVHSVKRGQLSVPNAVPEVLDVSRSGYYAWKTGKVINLRRKTK